jgi:hypothetical protein
LGDFGIFQVGLASKVEGPETLGIADLHSARGFTQNFPNYLGRGLDEFRELAILIDGLGVDQAVAGASQSGRREGSSQRKIKRRPEVDPIVRFFTSTG